MTPPIKINNIHHSSLWTYCMFCSIMFCFPMDSDAQRTIGVVSKDILEEGYILMSPIGTKVSYLIDMCGEVKKKWESDFFIGPNAVLMPNGHLLRSGRIGGAFNGGGIGGIIELFDWDGRRIWAQTFANDSLHQHHTLCPSGDDSFFMITWFKYSNEEAMDRGFDNDIWGGKDVWSERIYEIKILPSGGYDILWQWDAWHHAIQDRFPDKANYGIIADNPHVIDVNFRQTSEANISEWLHVNAIDYNADLDLIAISSKVNNEIYVVDHSTTIDEAAQHTGGYYGRGGDILYRWGNPQAYGRGTEEDHYLFGQHDIQWIKPDLDGEGQFLVFNNGTGRPQGDYSSIDQWKMPDLKDERLLFDTVSRQFLPHQVTWRYTDPQQSDFFSARMSGVQRVLTDKTLVCEANKGSIKIIDNAHNSVWHYINPISTMGTLIQGSPPMKNDVFDAHFYSAESSMFEGKGFDDWGTLEENSDEWQCDRVSVDEHIATHNVSWINKGTTLAMYTEGRTFVPSINHSIVIYDHIGQAVAEQNVINNLTEVDISHLGYGMYIAILRDDTYQTIDYYIFIKTI